MNRKIGINIAVIVLLVIGAMVAYEVLLTDKIGPVIHFAKSDIVYTEGQDESVLLEGVTAEDNKDGDVSDTLIITKKVVLADGAVMDVWYAAKDKSNNVTTEKLQVSYVQTGEKKDSQENNKDEENNSEESSSEETSAEETTQGNEQVQNEDPTGEINIEAANATGIPVIKLNATEATITEGEAFDAISYVKGTYDNSGDVSRRIRIIGEENVGRAGDYELTYSVSDTEGNVSEPVKFILHVKPKENNQPQQTENSNPAQNAGQNNNENNNQNNQGQNPQ